MEVDPDIRVYILTEAYTTFSAGFDLQQEEGNKETQPDQWREKLNGYLDTFVKVGDLTRSVVAPVNGYALTGTCELVPKCDINIASENAIMSEPENPRPHRTTIAHHVFQCQSRQRQRNSVKRGRTLSGENPPGKQSRNP